MMVLKIKTMWSVGGGGVQLTSIPLWIVKSALYIPNKSPGFHKSFLKLCLIQNCIFLWQVCSLLRCFQAKGQIKSNQFGHAVNFPKKWTNEFVLFAVKSKKASKTNLFVHFLGEYTARQSALGFIWPLGSTSEYLSSSSLNLNDLQIYLLFLKLCWTAKL